MLTQFLGPAGKGQQGLVITTITFILVFSNLVGGATLVYLAPRRDSSLLLLPSYSWTVLMSLLALPVLSLFNLVDPVFTVHVCILAALNSFTTIHTSMLIGRERIRTANIISLIQPAIIIISLLLFFLVFDWPSIWAYIMSLYISACLTLVISYVYLVRMAGNIVTGTLRGYMKVMAEMFRYGFMNQAAHITQMLSFRMSFYVLNAYHGESSVGVYSTGISLAESVWLIAKSISLVQYARIANTDDRAYSQRITVQLSKASLLLSVVVLIPLLLFPAHVYTYVFGEGFGDVRLVIWALSGGVIIYNLSILLGHYFSGTGRYHINTLASMGGLIVAVSLFYLLIPSYSIAGAGIATSISYLFTTLILLIFFVRDNPGNFMRSLSFRGDLDVLKRELGSKFRS